jgi:uncharacterized protein YbcV (DUF1398 family)
MGIRLKVGGFPILAEVLRQAGVRRNIWNLASTESLYLTTFPEFLAASWKAGVVRYVVDFEARNLTYYGCRGESYVEAYPGVNL